MEIPKKKRILVLGASGYIGSHIALPQHFSVFGTTRNVTHATHLIKADMAKEHDARAVFDTIKPHGVIHCAGQLRPTGGQTAQEFIDTNLKITENVIKYASWADRIVFLSSSMVYEDTLGRQAKESEETDPKTPYGIMKKMSEELLLNAYSTRHADLFILRLFNVAGRAGGFHSNLFSSFIYKCIQLGTPFNLNGSDFDTPDGYCVRDYVHIRDVVSAIRMCMERDASVYQGILNIGTGVGTSNLQLVNAIESYLGSKAYYQVGPRRTGDANTLIADISKAKEILGWEPVRSDLRQIIQSLS